MKEERKQERKKILSRSRISASRRSSNDLDAVNGETPVSLKTTRLESLEIEKGAI